MAIPLGLLITHAPDVLSAANKLWNTWKTRGVPENVDPDGDIKTQLAAIAGRLKVLEEGGEAQAELVKNMAEQLAALPVALSAVSRRSNVALALSGVALAMSLIAIMLLLAR
jgi:hypothetical protein